MPGGDVANELHPHKDIFMSRRAALLVVLLLMLFAAAAHAQEEEVLPPIPSTIPRTTLRIYTPFVNGALHPSLTIAQEVTGSCTLQSYVAFRPDASRCELNDEPGRFLDPCFTNGGSSQLACITSPINSEVILLTHVDPSGFAPNTWTSISSILAQSRPWAMQVTNGAYCLNIPDPSIQVVGYLALYVCEDGGLLLDTINTTNPIWTVFYWTPGGIYAERVEVLMAYY
jgi:hypothetical protein